MSAMERSLRRALEAGDATDPAFRESIYAASERALERMLAAKPVDEAAAHLQRTRLAETINRVEDDFYERQTALGAAEDGPAQHDPALSLDPAYADAHAYSTRSAADGDDDDRSAANGESFELKPVFEAPKGTEEAGDDPAIGMMVAPSASEANLGANSGAAAVTEPVRVSQRTRSAMAAREATQRSNAQLRRFVVIVLAVLLVLGIGGYLVYASSGGSDGTAASENGAGRWIDLFDGKRLDAVATPSGGRMEAIGEDAAGGGRPAVRFTPSGEASAITVAVGPGVVSTLLGRKVLVELAAGSPDGSSRSFAVECRLGDAAVCGRQNFTTSRPNETFVFDMNVPNDASAGGLAITPTASATGASGLDLYAVRLRGA